LDEKKVQVMVISSSVLPAHDRPIKRPKNNMQTLDLPTSFAPQSRGYELDTSPVAFGYLDSAL